MSEEEGDGSVEGEAGESEDSPVDPDRVDERIERLEAIVRALEAGAVDPGERAARIAEGKALVADLERDLETVETDLEE